MNKKSVILKFKELYSNITLKEFAENCIMFKEEYQKLRQPPYHNLMLMREWKNWIYSLETELYKRDKIWEYLNDDITEEELYKFVKGVYYGR